MKFTRQQAADLLQFSLKDGSLQQAISKFNGIFPAKHITYLYSISEEARYKTYLKIGCFSASSTARPCPFEQSGGTEVYIQKPNDTSSSWDNLVKIYENT